MPKRVKHKPIIGLALSGGSTWGIAHLGALKALMEHHVPIDCIAGTSAGALVAALYAFGTPLETMIDISRDMKWKHIRSFARSRLGWASNQKIARLVEKILGDVQIENANLPLAIVATNIETGEKKTFRTGSVLDAVRASTSIPAYFTPVEIKGELYVDGGLTENLPLSPLKDMHADILIGVNLQGHTKKFRPSNIGHVISRSIDILAAHRDGHLREETHILIEPDLQTFNARNFADADRIFEEGYRAATEAVPAIKANIAALEASRMSRWDKLRLFLRFQKVTV